MQKPVFLGGALWVTFGLQVPALAHTGGMRLHKLPSGLAVGPTVGLDLAL